MRNILTKGQRASGLKVPESQCSLTICCMVAQLPSVAHSKQCSKWDGEEHGHRFLQKPKDMQRQSLSWHDFMERQLWSLVSAHLHRGSSGESLKARLAILVGSLSLWLPASIKFTLSGTLCRLCPVLWALGKCDTL